MKKINLLIVTLLALSLFWGCGKAQPEQPETAPKTETQIDEKTPSEETEEKTPAEKTEKEYPDVMECATGKGFLTAESLESNTPYQVRIIKKRDYEGNKAQKYDLYVNVDIGTKVLSLALDSGVIPVPSGDLYFADIDGDGTEEVFLQHHTGGTSHGFCTWVLKIENDKIRVLYEDPEDGFETGFESRLIDGFRMEVANSITAYTLVFDAQKYAKAYNWFDENGKVTCDVSFWMEALFSAFEPKDVDGDGTYEIEGQRYTCLDGHPDYVGTAYCVLKFNMDSQKFEVIDAWYEPVEDINIPPEQSNTDT